MHAALKSVRAVLKCCHTLYISNTEIAQLNFHRATQAFSNLNSYYLPLSYFFLTPPTLVSNGFFIGPRNPCRLLLLPTVLMIWHKIEEALSTYSLKKYKQSSSSQMECYFCHHLLWSQTNLTKHHQDAHRTFLQCVWKEFLQHNTR